MSLLKTQNMGQRMVHSFGGFQSPLFGRLCSWFSTFVGRNGVRLAMVNTMLIDSGLLSGRVEVGSKVVGEKA
jgi:hypothetical protein